MCAGVDLADGRAAHPARRGRRSHPGRVDVVDLGWPAAAGSAVRGGRGRRRAGHLAPRGDDRGAGRSGTATGRRRLDEVLGQLRVHQLVRDARPSAPRGRPAPRPGRGRTRRPGVSSAVVAACPSGRGRAPGRAAPAARRGPARPGQVHARSRRRTSARARRPAPGPARRARPSASATCCSMCHGGVHGERPWPRRSTATSRSSGSCSASTRQRAGVPRDPVQRDTGRPSAGPNRCDVERRSPSRSCQRVRRLATTGAPVGAPARNCRCRRGCIRA